MPETTVMAMNLNGSGTEEDPYIITTPEELDTVRYDLTAYYKLGNDIDITQYLEEGGAGCAKWSEKGWEPIGSAEQSFSGTFDGNNHTISGLWSSRVDEDDVALFGIISTDTGTVAVRDIEIKIAEQGITGNNNTAGLIGYSESGQVKNCVVTSESETAHIIGSVNVGGLIGNQSITSKTYDCSANVAVMSVSNCVGGLIGMASGSIMYSGSSGNVDGTEKCGGLVGCLTDMADVRYCISTSSVNASGNCIGGLVGYCWAASIAYSSSICDVKGNTYVGGLVGMEAGKSAISQCYAEGMVSANSDYAGGVVGAQISEPYLDNYNRVYRCYSKGSAVSSGEHVGAISGYADNESSIEESYRYSGYTINGTEVFEDASDSLPTAINGGVASDKKIVQPPTVSVSSGNVLIGSKVQITAQDGARIAYSINDSDLVYSYAASVELTITQNTTLKIKSWVDYRDESTEYITPTAEYTYKITPEEYPYTINSLKLISESGEALETAPTGSGFIAEISFTEIMERDISDYMFVCVYGTDGELLSLDYVKANLGANSECSFGFYVPAQDETVGSIIAYVWDGFTSMQPMAESKSLIFE